MYQTEAIMAEWTVRADYDPDSKSWYVFDSDVPGLSTGAASLEELEEKLPSMIVELLELNQHLFDEKSRINGPHSFRLVAHHEAFRAIAA
jgi:predicted RNase H-like HicB family nuclease